MALITTLKLKSFFPIVDTNFPVLPWRLLLPGGWLPFHGVCVIFLKVSNFSTRTTWLLSTAIQREILIPKDQMLTAKNSKRLLASSIKRDSGFVNHCPLLEWGFS